MSLQANLNIQGEYKVTVFNKNGSPLYSIGPHKNFITSTGLSMPMKYAFADCFRYLSIGGSDAKNTVLGNGGWGTTNLKSPFKDHLYIGGRTAENDNATHDASQYYSVGFSESANVLELSRSWRVPPGETFFTSDMTIKEVMLSPGRPYVTGISQTATQGETSPSSISAITIFDNEQDWITNAYVGQYVRTIETLEEQNWIQFKLITSNSANALNISPDSFHFVARPSSTITYSIYPPYSLCDCQETDTDLISALSVNGLDYSASAVYYKNAGYPICEDTGAFVRVVDDMPVYKDNYFRFDYALYITVDSGRKDFAIEVNNGRLYNGKKNWIDKSTGSFNLIHHGLKVINQDLPTDGYAPWGDVMTQVNGFAKTSDYGESYNGPWGSPLEPSTPASCIGAYLSTDNLQFFANARDGGGYVAGVPGLTSQSGLMLWRSTPFLETINGFNPRLYNIRRQADVNLNVSPFWPYPSDYKTETSTPELDARYDPGVLGFNYTAIPYDSTKTVIEHVKYIPSSRIRQTTRAFEFPGTHASAADFLNNPIRSIVLTYVDPLQDAYKIPYLDCLFTDGGKSATIAPYDSPHIIPRVDSPSVGQYRTGAGIYDYWNYLEGGETAAKLNFLFTEAWTSPCDPAEVDGC